jgi:hypothetical protein
VVGNDAGLPASTVTDCVDDVLHHGGDRGQTTPPVWFTGSLPGLALSLINDILDFSKITGQTA